MNILVPSSVRSSLDWLKFTAEEERIIDYIYATSLMVRGFGGDENIVDGVRRCWLNAREGSSDVGDDWVDFIQTKLFTLDELNLLVSDESPYYGLAVKHKITPSERFYYLMNDVTNERWAPLRVRKLWTDTLLRHGGDGIAAEISLEFLRP